jgi:aminoglycoside 6'-N-acetyltransferase
MVSFVVQRGVKERQQTENQNSPCRCAAFDPIWRMRIAFRPLAETDFPALAVWLNRPHLTRFFQKQSITLEEIAAKYGPRVRGDVPTHCHLATDDGRPFAYLQCYRLADWPEWAALVESSEGIGVDLAIFEPDIIGQGAGRAMLDTYLRDVAFPQFPAETKCFIAHEVENRAAIACSTAAGFAFVRNFFEGQVETALFVASRDKWAVSRG